MDSNLGMAGSNLRAHHPEFCWWEHGDLTSERERVVLLVVPIEKISTGGLGSWPFVLDAINL